MRASELAELGRVVSVRTQNGTMDIDTRQNICYTLARNGELHRVAGERFHRSLEPGSYTHLDGYKRQGGRYRYRRYQTMQ